MRDWFLVTLGTTLSVGLAAGCVPQSSVSCRDPNAGYGGYYSSPYACVCSSQPDNGEVQGIKTCVQGTSTPLCCADSLFLQGNGGTCHCLRQAKYLCTVTSYNCSCSGTNYSGGSTECPAAMTNCCVDNQGTGDCTCNTDPKCPATSRKVAACPAGLLTCAADQKQMSSCSPAFDAWL